MKQELISWAHSSHMISIFEISDWINSSLFSISRSVSRLNRVHDLNCRSFFILFSSLPLIIGTFVTESTAVLCCTEPGTAFKKLYSNKGAFCNHIASNKMCVWFLHGQKTYPHYHVCQIFCHTKNIAWSLISVHCLSKEVYCLTEEIFCVPKGQDNPQIGDTADNACYYTSDSLWKIWLVESIQSIHNSLWTWHD